MAVGERIQVFDEHRARLDGRFEGLAGASLRVRVKGSVVDVPAARISEIRRERPEADGVLIGLGIGALVGLATVQGLCSDASEHEDCLRAGSLVIGAPIAAAGALVDWGLKTFETIYRRPASSARWFVSPLVAPHQRGVTVRFVF
jgi:hypothetical protein